MPQQGEADGRRRGSAGYQEVHVVLELAAAVEKVSEALDRHVGDGVESVELDTERIPQLQSDMEKSL